MSDIERLSIRGIRSFDPSTVQTIDFQSPLTLIVGRNGTGKTTIIECLKYATTGELPPGGKGGAFIHDPRVAHEAVVKAQIKLQFRDQRQNQVLCIRSLQVTQKKSKMECKTLDGSVRYRDRLTNEEVTLSKRCSELDVEIPALLGVSKAILENVIFCHQEDSFWQVLTLFSSLHAYWIRPLSDPTTLKKKFDDIFAVAKYTKALDFLKTMRKECQTDLKLESNELEYVKLNRDRGQKTREKWSVTQSRLQQSQEDQKRLLVEQEQTAQEMTGLEEEIREWVDREDRWKSLQRELDMKERQLFEMKESMTALQGSEAELERQLEEHTDRVADADGYALELQARRETIMQDIMACQKRLTELATERGTLEAEVKSIEDQISRRMAWIKELGQMENLDPEIIASADHQVISNELNMKLKEKEAALAMAKSNAEKRLETPRGKLILLAGEIRSCGDGKTNAIKFKAQLEKSKANILKQITDCTESGSKIDALRVQVSNQETHLESMRKQIEELEKDSRLLEFKTQMKSLDDEIMDLQAEMMKHQQLADVRANFRLKSEDRAKKQAQLDEIVAAFQARLASLRTSSDVSILSAFRKLKASVLQKKDELEKKLNDLRMQIATDELELNRATAEVSEKENLLSDLRKERLQFISVDTSRDIDREIEATKIDIMNAKSGKEFYMDLSRKTEAAHSCALCKRSMNAQELETTIKEIRKICEGLPSNSVAAEKSLTGLMEVKKSIERAREVKSRIELLENSIDEAAQSLRARERKFREKKKEAESASVEVAKIHTDLEGPKGLSSTSDKAANLLSDISALDFQLSEIEVNIGNEPSESTDFEDKMMELRAKRDRIQRDHDRTQQDLKLLMATLQNEVANYRSNREEILILENKASSISELQERLTDLERESKDIEEKIAMDDKNASDLEIEKINTENLLEELQESSRLEIQRAENALDKFTKLHRSIQEMDHQIRRFQEAHPPNQMESLGQLMSETHSRMDELNHEVTRLNQHLSEQSSCVADLQVLERNIRDNLQFRRLERSLDGLKELVSRMKKELDIADVETLRNRLAQCKRQHSNATNESSKLAGLIGLLQENARETESELRRDFKDVDAKYREKLVSVNSLELYSSDLEKSIKALDAGILKFHSAKMESINKVIRRLWMYTYKGGDIDRIAIRSEVENTRGNRSYNYRVVMVKGGEEIDMRGRCSAGQRVLTSIIIRLALAEVFCAKTCGILALDEPTTNLDEENVKSLALALNEIIDMRRSQSNFQLVVITHDDEFMQNLGNTDHADCFYRVERGPNRTSRIVKKYFGMEGDPI